MQNRVPRYHNKAILLAGDSLLLNHASHGVYDAWHETAVGKLLPQQEPNREAPKDRVLAIALLADNLKPR